MLGEISIDWAGGMAVSDVKRSGRHGDGVISLLCAATPIGSQTV